MKKTVFYPMRKGVVKSCIGMALAGLGVVCSATVSATTETEPNDTFATADAAGPGVFTGMIGDLSSVSNDVDVWSFDLTAGAGMGVSISNQPLQDYNDFDPLIVLFMQDNGNYYPVAANDPWTFSTSFGFTPWQSGTYFLTVSAFGNSPQDAFGNNQYDSQFWTDDYYGLGTPFFTFEGQSFTSFDYQLSFTGTVAPPVPLPAAFWLFGSGLAGLLAVSVRKKRSTSV